MRRLILLGGLWLAAGAAAAEADPLTPAQRDQAKAWVRQLGDRSFKTREQAQEKLAELGRAARPLLEDGLKADDNEVRSRCARLLELASRSDTEVALAAYMARKDVKALMKLPAWDRFSKLVGDNDDTRKLFVDMYCAEGPLLAELDRSPDNFVPRFRAHIQEVQRNLYTPLGQANPIPHSQVVALLFLASDPKLAADLNTFYMISNLFYQPTVQQAFKTDDASRKMLVGYLEKQANNPNTMAQGFYIARQLQLKEALPWAMKSVKDKNAQPNARGLAILFVGQTGDREMIKEIEPFLEDTTALGALRTGTMTLTTQMRDVALAALIQLSGQNVHDYDFPYMKNFRGVRGPVQLPPNYFGFSDDASRAAAVKRWKDSQSAKK